MRNISFTTVEAEHYARPQPETSDVKSVETASWSSVVRAVGRVAFGLGSAEKHIACAGDNDACRDGQEASIHVHGVDLATDIGLELVVWRSDCGTATEYSTRGGA